jgi:tetratricopeptide (TPR) repeat protein
VLLRCSEPRLVHSIALSNRTVAMQQPRLFSTVEISRSKASDDPEAVIGQMQGEYRAQYSRGNYEDALEVAQMCSAKIEQHFGAEHPVFASSLNDVAIMHKMLGQLQFAVDAYQRALTVYEDVIGKENPKYVTTLYNMGLVFKALAEQGSSLEKQVVLWTAQQTQRHLKPCSRHLHTLTAARHCRHCCHCRRRRCRRRRRRRRRNPRHHCRRQLLYDRAAETLEHTLELQKVAMDADDPNIGLAMSSLGICYEGMKKPEKAEAMLQEAVALAEDMQGDEHTATATALSSLVRAAGCLNRVLYEPVAVRAGA